ncbi:hypothetical protein D3C80_1645890 [compost metagenome]
MGDDELVAAVQRGQSAEELRAPTAFPDRAKAGDRAQDRCVLDQVGVVRSERHTHVDDRPALGACAGEQSAGRIEQRGTHAVIGPQPDPNLAFGVQHVVLIVQGDHHRRVHHTNTSRLANTSLQLMRSTRLSWICQPPPS